MILSIHARNLCVGIARENQMGLGLCVKRITLMALGESAGEIGPLIHGNRPLYFKRWRYPCIPPPQIHSIATSTKDN